MGLKDFVIESEGCCFLCRHQIAEVESPSIHSLHNLAQHLKLNMSKVFSEEGPIPQQLLDSVKKSRLKVQLCTECSNLVGKFSKLYRKMEKTEMEVACCLDLIHGKLVGSGRAELNLMDCHSKNKKLMNKMDIVNALRLDALQKCSQKLRCTRPRIKTRKLTFQQVNAKKLQLKTKSESRVSQNLDGTIVNEATADNSSEMETNDDMELGSSFSGGESDHLYKAENFNHNMSNVGGVAIDGVKVEKDLEPEATNVSTYNKPYNMKMKNTEVGRLSESIPDPIKTAGKGGKPRCTINPNTGKYKCHLCEREYAAEFNFRKHFKIAHLDEKHKCGVCGNSFTERTGYKQHYLSSHMGVRFKCIQCNKVFTTKRSLRTHQESAHQGKLTQ